MANYLTAAANGTLSIRSSQPNSNAYYNTSLTQTGKSGSESWRSLANFPLNELSTNMTIFNAYLNWYGAVLSSGNQVEITYRTGGFFSGTTWNTVVGGTGETFLGVGLLRNNTWATMGATGLVQAWASTAANNRYIDIHDDPAEGFNTFGGVGGVDGRPFFSVYYGINLSGLSMYTSGPRALTATWNGSTGADHYDVYFGPGSGSQTFQASVYGTSWSISNVSSATTYWITVYPIYPGYGNSVQQTTTSVPGKGTPDPPVATADSPIRKKITINKPGTTLVSNTSWDYRGVGTITKETDASTNSSEVLDFMTAAAQSVQTAVRARYSDGDVSNWSNNTPVKITQPTVTNLTATTNLPREIDLTWTTVADAATYNVSMDGGGSVSVAQPSSGTTASYNKTGIKSGSHTFVVTPVFTNGYTGAVTAGTISGTAILPSPSIPTGVGDSPNKREIACTGVKFYSNDSLDFRRDADDNTIINTVGTTATITKVPQGSHTIQVRGRWIDGDVSGWSLASDTITTSTPVPTSVAARQKSAPISSATTSISGTGITGSYFVAVSVNLAGNRSTSTVNSLTRATNESTPSPFTTDPIVLSNQGVTVTKPSNCTGTDTWNVYMGTNRNVLKRVATNLSSATATTNITTYSAPGSNEAKLGQIDLTWVAPTGQAGGDTVTYRVERAPSMPINVANGSPGAYIDVSSTGTTGFYSTINFYHDALDTKYWFFKVTAVYNNDASTPIEIVVTP